MAGRIAELLLLLLVLPFSAFAEDKKCSTEFNNSLKKVESTGDVITLANGAFGTIQQLVKDECGGEKVEAVIESLFNRSFEETKRRIGAGETVPVDPAVGLRFAATTLFDSLFLDGYLGASNCTSTLGGYLPQTGDLCGDIAAWLKMNRVGGDGDPKKLPNADKEVKEALQIVMRIQKSLEAIPTSESTRVAQRVFLAELADLLGLGQEGFASRPARWIMKKTMWEDEREVRFGRLLEAECDEPAGCSQAFSSLSGIFSHGAMVQRLLLGTVDRHQLRTIRHLGVLNARWTTYRKESRSQFPWEIAINDLAYEFDPFAGPPSRQWIAVHPSLGYEFSDHFEDSQFFEALVVEVFGVYRWSWKDDGSLKNPWGGAVIATWRDHPLDEPLGFGFIVHTPVESMSLGATWRDVAGEDEWSITMNVDLAKWLLDDGKFQEKVRERVFGLE